MEVVGGLRLIATLSGAAVIAGGVPAAAERRWQEGTWVQVGITRTPFVADRSANACRSASAHRR